MPVLSRHPVCFFSGFRLSPLWRDAQQAPGYRTQSYSTHQKFSPFPAARLLIYFSSKSLTLETEKFIKINIFIKHIFS
jgi:hypothetical protein